MIYADYAATTPLDSRVLDAMLPYLREEFYNASALYPAARQVRAAVEDARAGIAGLLGCESDELIFTSGGTESDNLAIKGIALHPEQKNRHIITSSIEHHALLESCEWLERFGFTTTYLPVDRYGRVSAADLEKAMTPDTFLVSVMWVNNELGTVQDIPALAAAAHRGGALFHTDIVQALGTQRVSAYECGADLMSLSSHKIYGPKGMGALFVKRGTPLSQIQNGGQQENYLRGGTENTAGIVGFGEAARLLAKEREGMLPQLRRWKEMLLREASGWDGVLIDSPLDCTADSVIHLAFRDIEAEGMLFWLAQRGIQVSMGSACNTKSVEPSHVVRAIGLPAEYARGAMRISLGRGMTDEKMTELISGIREIMNQMRGA